MRPPPLVTVVGVDPTEEIDPSPERAAPARRRVRGGRVPDGVREVPLRDGSRMWVRPIQPDDRERIVEGLAQLSARSRYLRFHSQVDHLTQSQLDYLVDVDHVDHEALVALDPDAEGTPGVAIARYIRLRDDPDVAEAAITVLDEYQGRGIGTSLVGLLEQEARERGIGTFRNYVLAENQPLLEIFRQLGGHLEVEGPGLYRVDLPIPDVDEVRPDTPAGRLVASLGRSGEERHDTWLYPIMWAARKVIGADAGPAPDVEGIGPARLLKALKREPGERGR